MLLMPPVFATSHDLDAVVDRFLRSPSVNAASAPALDVEQTDSGYTVTLDMPGVAKEDVKVTIDGKRVTVEARSPESKADDGKRLIYRERSARRFARSFTMPEALDQSASSAKLDNGVLTLSLAKLAPAVQALTVN
jgi:HSP20 family protein